MERLLQKPIFHGKYNVEDFRIFVDSVRLDHIPDSVRWESIYQRWEGYATVKTRNDKRIRYNVELDSLGNSLKIKERAHGIYQHLHLEKFGDEGYLIQGKLYGDSIIVQLRKVPSEDEYLLNSRGFNWIQEYPFNR